MFINTQRTTINLRVGIEQEKLCPARLTNDILKKFVVTRLIGQFSLNKVFTWFYSVSPGEDMPLKRIKFTFS